MRTRFGSRGRAGRIGRAGLVLVAVGAAILLGAPAAGAGGWAVTTLDALPEVVAGRDQAIGFTIRQHGVRPVQPDGDVGIEVRDAEGRDRFFAARPQGPDGHYLATVRIPEPGTSRWTVRQGWFGPHDLGPMPIGSGSPAVGTVTGGERPASAGGSDGRWPLAARLLLPLGGVAFGAAAIVLTVQGRRPAEGLPAT